MTGRGGKKRLSAGATLLALCALALVCRTAPAPAGEKQPGVAGLSRQEALRLGERLYRQGLLPSGEPVTAMVQGDTPVEGTMFSCESCHMRSGLGSYEGGVLTTATNGATLYQPLSNVRQLTPAELANVPSSLRPLFQPPPLRPAYNDETLAAALREGIDPAGRELHSVMPRYLLDDRDTAILVHYLKSLSAEYSPGVTDTTLRFATVIAGEVAPEERDAMLTPLENYVRGRNSRARTVEARAKYVLFADPMDLAYRRLSLARWELKGPPGTWRRQLEKYYRQEPVFALLGGITSGEWRPVHEFCEALRIPCIFPITDFPVISGSDWYTLYFSRGLYQEGEAAARYLASQLPADGTVVQVFRDNREGRALAAGFRETWQGLGRRPPVNRTLRTGEKIGRGYLRRIADREKPAAVLLWTGPEALPALEAVAGAARPGMVFLSATLLKQSLGEVPEKARDFAYLTYPYARQSGKAPTPYVSLREASAGDQAPVSDRRIASKMYSLSVVLSDALMMMGRNFYRDRFLEVIDMLPDKSDHNTDYERISFGPGQRYAAKGCYIVQLTRGATPELVRKSEWVIH